jgi:mannose-6-phosphate isomerase-like protein (cupin superfamily)
MEFANINDTMRTAKEQDKRFVPLFGADNFRSWILYFRPGEHTDMHYHMSPETFLVLQGKASVKDSQEKNASLKKMRSCFLAPKITTRSPTSEWSPWCLWAIALKRSAARM